MRVFCRFFSSFYFTSLNFIAGLQLWSQPKLPARRGSPLWPNNEVGKAAQIPSSFIVFQGYIHSFHKGPLLNRDPILSLWSPSTALIGTAVLSSSLNRVFHSEKSSFCLFCGVILTQEGHTWRESRFLWQQLINNLIKMLMIDFNGHIESPVPSVQMWLPFDKVFTRRCCWAGQMTKQFWISFKHEVLTFLPLSSFFLVVAAVPCCCAHVGMKPFCIKTKKWNRWTVEFKDQGNLAQTLQLRASLSCTMSEHCICFLYHVMQSAATYWTDPPVLFFSLWEHRFAESRSALQRAHVHKFHILPQPVQFAIASFEAIGSLVRLACFLWPFKPEQRSWNDCDTCRFEVSTMR